MRHLYPGLVLWAAFGFVTAAVQAAGESSEPAHVPGLEVTSSGTEDHRELAKQIRTAEDDPLGRWTLSGVMRDSRRAHTTTLLLSGKVLVAGGELEDAPLASAELYDVATGTWTPTGSLLTSRMKHTATLLPSGNVLAVGGAASSGGGEFPVSPDSLSSAELYHPATGIWQPTGSLQSPRQYHTATLLSDGRILVVGGRIHRDAPPLAAAELYDPLTETWSPTGEMARGRSLHTATLLPSGRVLVVGGNALTRVEVYDSQTGSWTAVSPFRDARVGHSAILLPSGVVLVVGGTSNPQAADPVITAELYNPITDTWSMTVAPSAAHLFHTVTLLPSGRVLVAGGGKGNLFEQETELYDPVTRRWTSAGQLSKARRQHTATLLPSGSVLVVGGQSFVNSLSDTELYTLEDRAWQSIASPSAERIVHTATLLPSGGQRGKVLVEGWDGRPPELYDPATDTWASLDSVLSVHEGHTATLLPSGKVLFAGGGIEGGTRIDILGQYLPNVKPQTACKWYDSATDRWSPTGSLRHARVFHSATLLPSGKVLVAGGFQSLENTIPNVELYDPETGEWQEVAPLTKPRLLHTATLLPSGKVLVAGGLDEDFTRTAEIYDPTTDTWTPTGSLSFATFMHTATLLPSGKVLVAGGGMEPRSDIYDPATGTWSPTGQLARARLAHTATLLPSGRVLVTGGFSTQTEQDSELYDPATGSWSSAADLTAPRALHTATLLPSGELLLIGGGQGDLAAGFEAVDSAEIYRLEGRRGVRRPVILSVSERIRYGEALTLTGSHLGGAWEASQGDLKNSASNYPLIQVQSLEDGQKVWIPYDGVENFWDDPMTLRASRLPTALVLTPGWHLLRVFRAGTASRARLVEVGCGLVIDEHPRDQAVTPGDRATFTVETQGGRTFQWQRDGEDVPGATGSTYTTPPVTAADLGSTFRVVVDSGCTKAVSREAAVFVEDQGDPSVEILSPNGGEVWLLSAPNAPNVETVRWSMEDDTLVCQVRVSLLVSNDGGQSYREAVAATRNAGDPCRAPGLTLESLDYRVPTAIPFGEPDSLYKVEIEATDLEGNSTAARSRDPFFIVRPNDETVKTLIVVHPERMRVPRWPSRSRTRDRASSRGTTPGSSSVSTASTRRVHGSSAAPAWVWPSSSTRLWPWAVTSRWRACRARAARFASGCRSRGKTRPGNRSRRGTSGTVGHHERVNRASSNSLCSQAVEVRVTSRVPFRPGGSRIPGPGIPRQRRESCSHFVHPPDRS